MRTAQRRMGLLAALAGFMLAAPVAPVLAVDLEDLPPEVREKAQPVEINWSKQLNRTLEGALHLKGVQLPGRPDGAARTRVEAVHLGGLQAPAQLPVEEVGSSALSDAAQSLLVGLLAQGATSAEGWREQIETTGLTVADLCAIWRRFRREHPHQGERFGVASSLWAAIEASIPPEQRDPTGLPLDDAFSLGEIQLWARDGESAQQTFEAVVARLPEGPTTGRVSRGLLAYRIGQCRQQASDLDGALDWFLKCAEWGTPEMTGGYDVRGEGYVEAARMCQKLGRAEEAQGYYRKATDECGQWGQAVASMDLCGLLMEEKRPDEAIAVLEPLTRGGNGPVAAVYALLSIARLRCRQGDGVAARGSAERALEVLGAVTDAQALAVLASADDQARRVLSAIDRWETEPIVVRPQRLTLSPGAAAASAARFTVSTMTAGELTIGAPDWLIVEPAGDPMRGSSGMHRQFSARLKARAVEEARQGEIVIAFQGRPGWTARLPAEAHAIELEVSPREAFFGFIKPGEKKEQTITIRDRLGRPFTIRQCEVEGQAVEIGAPVRTGDAQWTIAITLATASEGSVKARLILTTDLPGTRPVQVPVYGHATTRAGAG